MTASTVRIPLDIPQEKKEVYVHNYTTATQGTTRLMLFAGDQKVEHMNDDFYGEGISQEDSTPEHLFQIASQARIGIFEAQLGLIAQYGKDYPTVPYMIKLNAKTNLSSVSGNDPVSKEWLSMQDVVKFQKESGLRILGVGYTIYFGSEHEAQMLSEAAQIIFEAHQEGLLTILWAYPRGKAVTKEKDPHIIAGAAGAAAALGADFVKVNAPVPSTGSAAEALKEVVLAAGRTKVICAGGSSEAPEKFLQTLYDQIHIGGTGGNATGRNIHQKPLAEAIAFCNAISAITYDNASVAQAMKIYND